MALMGGVPDSPRYSFSHDLISQNDAVPIPISDDHCFPSNPAAGDFDFCVFRESFDQESSSADELFSDGKILPIQIKQKPPPHVRKSRPPPPPPARQIDDPPPTKFPDNSSDGEEKHHSYKPSFWRIKRSSSLNCGSGYGGTLCPLPILSRSNSTGSTSSGAGKRSPNIPKQNSSKFSPLKQPSSSSKPPLKKSFHSNTTAVKITPILNVPPANLFGLGSIFSGGKKKH
ncbi:uncharacterized protein LOC127248764 [Andrographis paniculata]|uniref:uncharacterized protein LOC127248764 n=1 Tax=Andrographis paniculata TaxID=175694 RepID=UPI0021E7E921|nr:uncharacterized protein LOC127248764 [Andrographis paniculata]